MNEAAMQVQMEELQAYHNKLEEQARTRQFLGQVNEQLKYFQDLEREEKRQAELKVIFIHSWLFYFLLLVIANS